jgi:formylglycine-generating enzyme required for sulfatase activity
MAGSPDYRPPKAGPAAGGSTPRARGTGSEPASDPLSESKSGSAETGANSQKVKRRKKLPPVFPGDVRANEPLRGETPNLDTVAARQAGRLIVGSVAAVLALLVFFVGFRLILGTSANNEEIAEQKLVMEDVRKLKERNESEARTMLDRARAVARSGNTELAQSLLRRVASAYPETRAASEAHEALSHPQERLFQVLERSSDGDAAPVAQRRDPAAGQEPVEAPTADAASTAQPAPEPARPVPTAAGASAAPPVPAGLNTAAMADRAASTKPDTAPAAGTVPAALGVAMTAAGAEAAPVPPPRPLPSGYQPRSGTPVHPSGWPLEIVGGRDGAMMVLVPGGPFMMGCDGGDPTEAPAHPVIVSTFYIDKHEVTNRQFDRFVKDTGVRTDRSRALARDEGGVSLSEDYPVVMVSAKDAKDYADWAAKAVPTEAQWEKAARGTDQRLYPWGSLPPTWEKPRAFHQIDAVMSFPSDLSPSGAYDMAGNAVEWTRDWYDSTWYASFRGTTPQDPAGPGSRPASLQLTVKGGSKDWLVTAREGVKFDSRLPYVGFRCILAVEGPDSQLPPAAPGAVPANPGRGGVAKKVEVPY